METIKLQSTLELETWVRGMCGEGMRCAAIIDPSRYVSVEECRNALGLSEKAFAALPNIYGKYASSIREMGPRIFDQESGSPVWSHLFAEALTCQAASFIILPEATAGLLPHLEGLVRMPQPDGGNLLFRFQDVVVLSSLAPVLSGTQKIALLGPARYWLMADVCSHPISIENAPGCKSRSLQFRLDESQLSALDAAIAPLVIIFQADETDSSLLAGMSKCQKIRVIRDCMQKARLRGLKQEDDIALYCILSLQLPEDFDRVGPVAGALERTKVSGGSFGDEIDLVPVHQWRQWDEVLEAERER